VSATAARSLATSSPTAPTELAALRIRCLVLSHHAHYRLSVGPLPSPGEIVASSNLVYALITFPRFLLLSATAIATAAWFAVWIPLSAGDSLPFFPFFTTDPMA
jgi:hypothetical protein